MRDWLTAFGMDQGSAFKEMLEEIGKAVLVLLILDKLWVQKNEPWFEVRAAPGAGYLALRGATPAAWWRRGDDAWPDKTCSSPRQRNAAQDHLDFLSVQATVLGRSDLGIVGRTRVHMQQISYVGLAE